MPLDHELAGPAFADPADVVPGERRAARAVVALDGGDDGAAALRGEILEMRDALAQQGLGESLQQPARANQAAPDEARRRTQRNAEAVAQPVFAARGNLHVGGDDEHRHRGGDALEQRADDLALRGDVGLIPGARRLAHHPLERHGGSHSENGGQTRLGGGARQGHVAVEAAQARDAHGRDAEGRGVFAAEEFDLLRASRHVDQRPRQEAQRVKASRLPRREVWSSEPPLT